MLENYSRICLLINRYESENIPKGSIGYIIETYDDGAYEVEFSDSNGITRGLLVLNESDMQLAPLSTNQKTLSKSNHVQQDRFSPVFN
jgi:hypothetical protein